MYYLGIDRGEGQGGRTYYYLVESARVGGKPRIVSQRYVGSADDLEMRNPATGAALTVTVICVLDDAVPWEMGGITTSQATLTPFGDRARPSTFWFSLADGADPDAMATALEAGFLDLGLEAQTLRDRLDEAVAAPWTFMRLIEGFIALGLVVGLVALGVVSARAVVERRQQIGVLRAIGFQPAMVRLALTSAARRSTTSSPPAVASGSAPGPNGSTPSCRTTTSASSWVLRGGRPRSAWSA